MAKNCNIKCPAGLTTNPELYQGDPRALAQYFVNLSHEVREILASLGYQSLREIRGRSELLYLVDHSAMVGQLDVSALLVNVDEVTITKPVYLEANFSRDDNFIKKVITDFIDKPEVNQPLVIEGPVLNNCDKTTGGQFSIDIERLLNYELTAEQVAQHPAINVLSNGRKVLASDSITINTYNSAGQSYGAFNNSGVTMCHSGTCNDGVGKGISGGRLIVKNSGGGATEEMGNVLIGNFALFGATGGELFVDGQAGDRFGVRNSGAVAVVEGVGDFCCEYMTNGAIVNIGVYGKGFGNGMSGGTAYQFDPSGEIVDRCSQDSVKAISLADNDENYQYLLQGQETALHYHLSQHLLATNSTQIQNLLDDWQNAKANFYVLIPLALFNYQCSDLILKNTNRKINLEELAQYSAKQQITDIKEAYRDAAQNQYLFEGRIPEYGDRDTQLICQYINATGAIRRAFELAEKSQSANQSSGDQTATVDRMTRYLFETEDRKLIESLAKDAKSVLATYNDEALASLIASKRIQDYKDSLNKREVWDSSAWGTSAWIIERDRINQAELLNYPNFEQQLAAHYCHLLAIVIKDAA
jgi:glutamate synthase (NADPH/NADH) large chain